MRGSLYIIPLALLVVSACSRPSAVPSIRAKSSANGGTARTIDANPPRPTTLKWQSTYDSAGRIAKLVDPAGKASRFQYESDERGRVRKAIREVDGGSPVTFEFDEFDRVELVQDSQGTIQYEHDGFNRLVAARRKGSPSISWKFDGVDRISALAVGQSVVGYRYDAIGRLIAMDTPAGVVTYEFEPGKFQVHRRLPNGVLTTWQYNPRGQLTSLNHTSNNKTLASFAYFYRPDGRIERIEEHGLAGENACTIKWEYDSEGRLIVDADSARGTSTYHYDEMGNRTRYQMPRSPEVVSTYDWSGKFLTGQSFSYDQAGNLTDCVTRHGSRKFKFTVENQLHQIDGRVAYTYDGWGNIVERKTSDSAQTFILDPMADIWRPLLIQGNDGSPSLMVWEGDHLLAQIGSDGPRFYLEDQLCSIRCVTDASGSVVAQQRFSPFGIPENELGKQGLQPGFAGLFYDPIAQLYLTKARAYDPELGFLQPDPVHRTPYGKPWDMSPYVWCGHDPNLVDTDGCEPQPPRIFPDDDRLHRIQRTANTVQNIQTSTNTVRVQPAVTSNVSIEKSLGLPTVHFHSTLAVGWGDGAKSHNHLLQQAAGRFQLIDVTAPSPRGVFAGDIPKAFNTDIMTARTFERSTPYTSDHVVAHSGGNHLNFSGNPNIIRIGPSSQNEQLNSGRSQTIFPDIVSRLTKLSPTLEQGYAGVKISGRFGSNPVDGVRELAKNAFDVARGAIEFPGAFVSGFESHAKTTHFKEVDAMHVIPPRYTYSRVQVRTPDGVFTYSRKDVSNWEFEGKSSELKSPDDQKRAGPPPGGGSNSALATTSGTLGHNVTYGTPFDGIGGGLVNVSKFVTELRQSGTTSDNSSGPSVPSNIGGVYLGGAKIFNECGQLRGVYFDKESGRLTLLTEDGKNRLLPPLSLDEIVTVFRAVYSGEAPFVSIDPDPKDPQGKLMLVRHSQATAGTYTGWICFEADRLMKAASLGVDNNTGQPFRPDISGYEELLSLNPRRGSSNKEQWERFWIVSGVERRQAANDGAAFLDISMQVRTQVMKLIAGKLESVEKAPSSRDAAAFTKWFTARYPQIESTLSSTPPAENNINTSIAVFTELKRLALLTAAAEALRDQGVPLPAWMNDYHIRKFHVPETTPAIRTQRQETVGRTTYTKQAFGGVTLSPREGQGLRNLPATPRQEALAVELARVAKQAPQLIPMAIQGDGEQFRAVTLPTEHGVALGALQLNEGDLVIPLTGGRSLSLNRRFHSFFSPRDIFGDSSWTLDLPRLEKQLTEIGRTGDRVQYSVNFRLASPLGSYSGVTEALKGDEARLGRPSVVVRGSNHPILHFEEETGQLLATEEGENMTIYRRDATQRLVCLESWAGQNREAAIQLEYDNHRVVAARDSSGRSVRYNYDNDGNLASVERTDSIATYQYTNGLVTELSDNHGSRNSFRYNGFGQLVSQSLADGTEQQLVYDIAPDGQSRVTMRTLDGDGNKVERSVCEDGSATVSLESAYGNCHHLTLKPHQQRLDWQLPSGGTYRFQRDSHGRVVDILQDGKPMVSQSWTALGQLSTIRWEGTKIRSDYHPSGELRELRIQAQDATNAPELTQVLDELGRSRSLSFRSEATWDFAYDGSHLTRSHFHDETGKTLSDLNYEWTTTGQLRSMRAAWGDEQRYSYVGTSLASMEMQRAGKHATLDFEGGLPTRVRNFEGGETTIEYDQNDHVESIKTPGGLTLSYEYDADQRLKRVQCGTAYSWHYDYDAAGRMTGLTQVAGGK